MLHIFWGGKSKFYPSSVDDYNCNDGVGMQVFANELNPVVIIIFIWRKSLSLEETLLKIHK